MNKVIRYECPHCSKLFKTSNRHNCKMNPDKKNCYTCKHYTGDWTDGEIIDVGFGPFNGPYEEPAMECRKEHYITLSDIQDSGYNMQCEDYKYCGGKWIDYELERLKLVHEEPEEIQF